MKNSVKKVAEGIKTALLITAVIFCLAETEAVSKAVYDALIRCITVIIPSLYAMMIIAVLISKSGITELFPSFLGRAVQFLFSTFAGYPAGARLLCEEHKSGRITKRSAELLSGTFYGAGPAFVFGCISRELYSSSTPGRIILASTISANIITAIAIALILKREPGKCPSYAKRAVKFSGEMLTEAVSSGGASIMSICFTIMAFSVISAMLKASGTTSYAAELFSYVSGLSRTTAEGIITAAVDITAVSGLTKNNYLLLPYLSALVSFGGICVIFQLSAITKGSLSMKPFLLIRAIASLLSFVICRGIMHFMPLEEAITVSTVTVHTHSAPSPVPSIMLVVMTLMLIAEIPFNRKTNRFN